MDTHYTEEKHIRILIALLKAKGIKKVVASPGATNVTFVASIQSDPFFEIYSSVDERSAAYIASGLSAESGEAVVLTCTGATASRNYYSGLTEAYYRGLPVLAITASQVISHTGHYFPQMLDRTVIANDIAKYSVTIEPIDNEDDEWNVTNQINVALMELFDNGAGPVHINCVTRYCRDFSVVSLPNVCVIKRILPKDIFPKLPQGKIGIYVGSHAKWSKELTGAVDSFCASYNAVVFSDHTSNYKGKYKILDSLFGSQDMFRPDVLNWDLMIHVGYVTGEYSAVTAKEVWRVNPDGKLRNVFKKTTNIFQMEEIEFFSRYKNDMGQENSFFYQCKAIYKRIYEKIPELPFSNPWCAKQISMKLPENSVLHLGILNTLRSWNFFDIPDTVSAYSNTGGFGIDGGVSSLVGASLANPNKLYFGIFGDLAFFYDINVTGNRHVSNNVRIMLINNGRGTEFRNYNHPAQAFDADADAYMAAAGHFGNKSKVLIKHYAEDLGYEYLCSENKEEFISASERFLMAKITTRPIIFEVFTDSRDESEAIHIIRNLETSVKSSAKHFVKDIIGKKNTEKLKKILGR